MDTYSIWPTSATTAECDPVVLRQTEQRRLVFRPLLVDNPSDAGSSVRGTFVYQRKRKADAWEDHNELPLTKLRAEEWVRLELSAAEVHALVSHLAALYRFHRKAGIPRRRVTLLKIELDREEADSLRELDFRRLFRLGRTAGFDLIGQFVSWLSDVENAPLALEHLSEIRKPALERVGSLVQLTALGKTVREWEARLEVRDEEYWQESFKQNAFIVSQMVAYPLIVVAGKAYVGGKGIDNRGGHVADYLARNPLTGNAAIIEIKTPVAPLLGSEYRHGIYPLSGELSGAVSQVLSYRQSLVTKYESLRDETLTELEVFRPQGIVIGGNATRELDSREKRRSFELLRCELKDVTILAFDELVANARILLDALTQEAAR